jgi:hypothetical protein
VLLLRIVGSLVLVTMGVSIVTFLLTKDRRWLRFAWQVFKYGLVFGAAVFVLLALERIVLVPL